MNKTLIAFLVLAALVVGGIVGYVAIPAKFGAQTVNYSTSGGSANLYNNLASIVTDLTAVRAPLAGLVTGSSTFGTGALGPLGATTSTTSTSITVTGALQGDGVLCGTSTGTVQTFVGCSVTAANTVTLIVTNVSTTAQTPATSSYSAIVLPKTSFVAPAALNTVTSTSN